MRALIEAITNRLNPVLVYEMRQGFHNRILLSLLLFHIGLLIVIPFFRGNQPWNWTLNANETPDLLMVRITFDFCILILLLFPVARFTDDLVKKDLVFLTAINGPRQLIGKIYSGMAHTAIFYLVSAPFVAFWCVYSGSDPLKTAITALITYFVLILINVVCLGFMAGTRGAIQAIWLGTLIVLYLSYGFYMSAGAARVLNGMLGSSLVMPKGFAGIGFELLDLMPLFLVFQPFVFEWSELPIILLTVLLAVIPAVIAFFIGIAFLGPASSNRMLPLRTGMSAIGFGLLSCSFVSGFFGDPGAQFCQWCRMIGVVLAASLIVGVSEREDWGARIRATISKSSPVRFCEFPVFTGAPCAFLWVFVSLLVLAGFTLLMSQQGAVVSDDGGRYMVTFALSVFSGTLLIFVICAVSLAVRNLFFVNSIPKEKIWMIPGILLLSLFIVTLSVYFVQASGMLPKERPFPDSLVFNPFLFALIDPSFQLLLGLPFEPAVAETLIMRQFYVALPLFIVCSLCGLPWLRRSWKRFEHVDSNLTDRTDASD